MSGIVISDGAYEDVVATSQVATVWRQGLVLSVNATSGKYVPYRPFFSNGVGIPKAVLTEEVVFISPGDQVIRPLVSGVVRLHLLSDEFNGLLAQQAVDHLRDYTIIAQQVRQRSIQDNQ